jgi:hypothetical protein
MVGVMMAPTIVRKYVTQHKQHLALEELALQFKWGSTEKEKMTSYR